MSFELKHKDGLGRIGLLETHSGLIETPCFLPVINPIHQILDPNDLKTAGATAVITNAYIIHSNERARNAALEFGIHELIGWKGPVMTDSGAFQLMQYGDVKITNKAVIKFQSEIGTDIGLILDIPVAKGSRDDFKDALHETLKRAKEFEELEKNNDTLWVGPIQGGSHLDLVSECSSVVGKLSFDLHALGSVVPLLEQYAFSKVVEMIMAAKKELPINRPLHLFGAGHPMFFGLSVLMGCDLFDSAAYALFAKKERYLTVQGTYLLENLEYLPCVCPVCSKYELNDVSEMKHSEREVILALHNLYVSFQEIKLIKQSIREGSLWRLVSERIAAHPHLVNAWKRIFERNHIDFIERYEPLSKKKAFFITRREMLNHPMIIRHQQRMIDNFYAWNDTLVLTRTLNGLKSSLGWQTCLISDIFGVIPLELRLKYPILQHKSYNLSNNQEVHLKAFLDKNRMYFKNVLIHSSVENAIQFADDYDCTLENTLDIPTIERDQYDEIIVRSFLAYQYGVESINTISAPKIRRSKRTGRLGWIYDGNTPMASIRARDFMLIPRIKLAKALHKQLPAPNMRVVIDNAVEPFARKGKSLFAKFVKSAWEGLRAGDEVLIVNETDELVGTGTALLNSVEMIHFQKGMAVNTRAGIE